MTSYSSFRGLGKHTEACQTGSLIPLQNKSEVKKSVCLTGMSLPNPLNDGALTSLGDAIGGWNKTRSSQWSEGKFQKMFLVPPGRKRANLLVGLNREIIQTGWGIGDPLQFLLSFSLLHFAFCLRWLHRNYCIEVCHEEIGSEANVFPIQTPNRYTLSSYSRSVFVHSLTPSN